MPAVPLLMVLYTNDAVEVRYSNGSCLQIAPCGSTFVHHESPGEAIHPVHGMKTIHQKTRFVTSDYKHKVVEALDFRNRFAERPFVCPDLIHPDQIVELYADIQDVAWPKEYGKANYEYLPDGSVRLISEDEYSSMVLSTHRQDFTVCYLSRVSQEKKKFRSKKYDFKFQAKSMCETRDDESVKSGKKNKFTELCDNSKAEVTKDKSENVVLNNNTGTDSITPRSNCPNRDVDNSDPNDIEGKFQQNLSISPISLASSQCSKDNSPISQEDKDEFRRFSTPTYLVQGQAHLIQKTSAFRQYKQEHYAGANDGSFLDNCPSQQVKDEFVFPESNSVNSSLTQYPCSSNNSSGCSLSFNNTLQNSGSGSVKKSQKLDDLPLGKETGNGSKFEEEKDLKSSSRSLYTWVTRHFSCEECPVSWSHPVNIARAVLDNKESLEEKAKKLSDPQKSKKSAAGCPRKINQDKCCMSPLPVPLALTCPGQHLHKPGKYVYDTEQSLEENFMDFKQGKLKVILIEGVVYRLVRLASTLGVEIFPGDRSVILSQGLTGHFYKHVIPKGHQQVEERTYSLKSLPATPPKAAYSIQKLLKRANRFLLQASQEDKMITNADVCCWKYEDKKIEILPTTLLEDCHVPGFGKFTAFSNGHIRIVFHDRTSLDMMGDFSQRIQSCLEHSKTGETTARCTDDQGTVLVTKPRMTSQHSQDLCKLLLPNGQYQTVDIHHPGVYSRYVNAALEWQQWVNSSPSQRKIFYENWETQDSHHIVAAKELQKIKCFNYLVDNTMPTQRVDDFCNIQGIPLQGRQSSDTDKKLQGQNFSASKLLNNDCSNYDISSNASRDPAHGKFKSHINHTSSAIHFSHQGYREGYVSSTGEQNMRYTDKSAPPLRVSQGLQRNTNHQIMLGFNSVREALLKTSQAIKDIDEILDKK